MILWWKWNLKLRCNLKISMRFCSKYILKSESKKPIPVQQNWVRKTTQTITKTDHAKNDFKDKQTIIYWLTFTSSVV